ncbi:MAG TPA: hypothetical protein DCF33_16495, partial [Saprospirales bacterium]|nr:hypothetical protein [Saprospirales bacterium]
MGNHGGFDNWITALSSSGSLLWQKTMGGSLDDFGYHLTKVDEHEMVVVGGTRSNNGDVSGNHGSSDYWIVKLS